MVPALVLVCGSALCMIRGRVDLLYVCIVAHVCGVDVGAHVYVGELCV